MNKSLSSKEAFLIFIMFGINSTILNAPKILITQNSTGAFINSLIIGLLSLIFIIIVNQMLAYHPSSDILDISNYIGGKKLRTIIGFLFIIILYFIITIYISQFVVLLKTVYFKHSPNLFILLFFIISIFICNLSSFTAVKKSICFYCPLCIITLILVLTNTMQDFSITKITPILGNSFENNSIYGISNIFVFTNIILLLFISPFLENTKRLKSISIITFLITWIFLSLSVLSILNNYPINNNITDLNPLYTLTRKIKLTDFIERSDGIFVTIALISCLSYISFLFYLITHIIKKVFTLENEKMIIYSQIPFVIGSSYLMIITNKYQNTLLHKNIFNITIYIISFFIIFFSLFKKKLNP